ncbi:carboxypeptidase-like regulatory domain-containing protein [Faecalibacter sp. LW9]|uniref:carboxypeptidase-like regulatory domain-containing protein n=1 Tax=Faecalibacter sp. LW9 TaxID=3103144 RepID=UPI002AFE2DA8|nr:carboxypeptidase-like regulatory domain-containing protein [Faecalibacter sp. LW9]
MNKLLLSISLFASVVGVVQAQTKITGTAKNSATGEEVYNLTVRLDGMSNDAVLTDRIGYFQFVDVPDGTYKLQIFGVGFDPYEQTISVAGQKEIELGEVLLTYNPNNVDVGLITLNDDELSSDESSTSSSAGLLQSSRDVFARVAAFELGSYWFKPRGYDNKYNDVHFNGVRMNKIDNGRATFNNWGGLNDVTRRPDELTYALEPSSYAFGDIGGVTNFDTRPSTMRKGVSLSYSATNRSYRNRIMATYNTGLMNNGWAVMFSGSRRWAEEGLVEGTFHDSWGYFLGVEKRINKNHTLNFTTFGAPNRRSTGSANTQEMVDMKGIYYNSFWGWQDGEKRNERVKETYEPVYQLSHHWNINDKSKLLTTVSYQTGREAGSRLDWYNAPNPTPNYYRNLPSWYLYNNDQEGYELQRENWLNGSASQLNWNRLYQSNLNVNKHSVYYLTNDVNEDKTASFYTNFKTELTDKIDIVVAATYQNVKSELFREVEDLLGGNYVLNYDDFNKYYFDENNKDYVAREGDRHEYNYEINRNYADLYFQSKIKGSFLDLTVGMRASYTDFYRDGKFLNGLYRENSFGKSKTYDFLNFGVKSNFLFKLDGRNFISLNGQYSTEAPTADEVFPNARLHDITVEEGIVNAKILSTDLSYVYRGPRVKARATGFYTKIEDEIEKGFGYIDGGEGQYFVAEVMTGVDKQYLGGEVAIEAQITPTIKVTGAAALGQYTYTNNPNYYLFSDDFMVDGGEAYKNYGTAYLKDYKLQTGPQSGYSLGIEYRDPKFWWVGVSGNYLTNNYLDVAPYRRTTNFITNTQSTVTEESLREVLKQQRVSDEFMLNLNIGKTFRFGQYYLGTSLTVNNVLDNENYITGGFEQLRLGNYDNAINQHQQTLFGPRMFYGAGRTFFFNVYLRF